MSASATPLPPDELIDRVTPGVFEHSAQESRDGFLDSGRQSAADLRRALGAIDRTPESYPRILEFGCGCGRIMAWLGELARTSELHGTDIDADAIAWCRENIPYAEFGVNPHTPPMSYPDASFDLVYNHSVLTHLDEEYQDLWLAELRRITKPGGTVVLTVHGEHVFDQTEQATASSGEDTRAWRERMQRDGILFVAEDSYVGSVFPDFYHTAFHAPWYVFEHWGQLFTVRAYLPRAALEFQDMVVLERPVGDDPVPRPVPARPGGAAAVDGAPAAPPAPVDTGALGRVQAELDRGVAPRNPSRFGAPGEFARRAVLRLIKPYTTLERDLDRELAQALQETQQRTDDVHRLTSTAIRMPPLVQDVLNRQSERIKRLDADLREELTRLADRIERLERGRSDER